MLAGSSVIRLVQRLCWIQKHARSISYELLMVIAAAM